MTTTPPHTEPHVGDKVTIKGVDFIVTEVCDCRGPRLLELVIEQLLPPTPERTTQE